MYTLEIDHLAGRAADKDEKERCTGEGDSAVF